jgi:hypothetical protein
MCGTCACSSSSRSTTSGASTTTNGLSGSCASSSGRKRFKYTAVHSDSASVIPSGGPGSSFSCKKIRTPRMSALGRCSPIRPTLVNRKRSKPSNSALDWERRLSSRPRLMRARCPHQAILRPEQQGSIHKRQHPANVCDREYSSFMNFEYRANDFISKFSIIRILIG